MSNVEQENIKQAICPYCKTELFPTPTRKKKCPHCGETFLVRTHYKTKERLILTEEQVAAYDTESEYYHRTQSFITSLKDISGATEEFVDEMVKETEKELLQTSGTTVSLEDIAWAVSNKLIVSHPKVAHLIHFKQAMFLHEEGKEHFYILEKDFEDQLKEYQRNGYKKVSIITAREQSCIECRTLENKIVAIDEALEKRLLPCKNCSFKFNQNAPEGWCRCLYAIEFE